MTRSSLSDRRGRTSGGSTAGAATASRPTARVPRTARGAADPHAAAEPKCEPLPPPVNLEPANLETAGAMWWSALDAADSALRAAGRSLTAQERRELGARLSSERALTVKLLDDVARVQRQRTRFSHLLVPRSNLRRVLGLPATVNACVFNLDGVLIGSAALHEAAWAETFDPFILARIERTHGRFAPFNPRTDYPHHIHGKPRLDGVRAFLASRGISLPEGRAGDPPGAETVHGLANRKHEALLRRIEAQGVRAFDGSRRYLQTARDAGVHRAVVSASANTGMILERAGLSGLIEATVDGNTIAAEHLRSKPAPDTLLAACARLGVEPQHAAAFETTLAGVAAARAGDFKLVIAVDQAGNTDRLRERGADLVIPGLAELFERNLAA
jgi:HAD superfamily hydrolase (TIGR01509 family)